jgi:hypothetical protein
MSMPARLIAALLAQLLPVVITLIQHRLRRRRR